MIQSIETNDAPSAIGTYSQAVRTGDLLFVSGQIGMSPDTGELVSTEFKAQSAQAFNNLAAIIEAAGGVLAQAVKINISVVDIQQFAIFNEVMATFFAEPYPARAVVEVAGLPKGALVEIEAVVELVSR